MIRRRHLATLSALALLTLGAGVPAGAQSPLSLQATLGAGFGFGGPEATNRHGVSAEVLAGARAPAFAPPGTVVGLSAGLQGALVTTDVCIIRPDGGCVPDFPIFMHVGALAGRENRARTLRVMGGPAYFHGVEEEGTLGLTARVEGAPRLSIPLRPVVSLRGAVLPRYRESTVTLLAVGVGLRVG